MDGDYFTTFKTVYDIISTYNETTELNVTCVSKIDHYVYYQQMITPALLIIIVFAMLQTRRKKLKHIFYGRPGLVYPMDALTRSASISFVAAFGGTLTLVLEVIFHQKFAFKYEGPLALKTLVLVASMLWYGIVFFPVFASLALKSIFSYGLGSLYVWAMLAIRIYLQTECEYPILYRFIYVAQFLPHLLCLAYLSISLPVRFFFALKTKKYFHSEETDLDVPQTLTYIKESYHGVYVRKLLQRPPPKPKPPVTKCGKIQALLIKTFHRVVYKNEKGFRYSSRIVSVMMMGAFVLYTVAYRLLIKFVPLFDVFLNYGNYYFENTKYHPTGHETVSFTDPHSWIYMVYFLLLSLKICTIVSVGLALVIVLFSMLHMLSSYRFNLLSLYRGDHTHIPERKHSSNAGLMVGCMRYAGYQVAYIAWGYIVQVIILFLLCLGISIIVILVRAGVSSWLVNQVLQLWPIALWTLVLNVLQYLLAKFLFLLGRGDTLSIDNRRFFFIFTYFMFFFNIFLGLVSCLLRIIKAIVLGALFLPRLDHSTLSRAFQFFDPGFAAYVGFIHVENQHTHPVMIVFIRLMLMNLHFRKLGTTTSADQNDAVQNGSTKNVANGFQQIEMSNGKSLSQEAKRKKYKAVFKWQLFYTLINNPQTRLYRKGYMQLAMSARRRGLKVPISDLPTTDLTEWLAHDEGKADVTDKPPHEVKEHLDSNGNDFSSSFDKLDTVLW